MEYIISILIGYFLGSINPAFLLGKLRGFDIRKQGSNNAGASNAAVTMGLKFGVLVALLDIGKSFLAGIAAKMIFPGSDYAGYIGSVSAIFGHMYPVWMGFKGGKGLACLFGLFLFYDVRLFGILAVLVAAITLILNYIALGTLTVSVFFPIYLYFTTRDVTLTAIVGSVCIVIISKHIVNIKRMIRGEEIGVSRLLKRKRD